MSRSAFTFYEFFAGGGMARTGLGAGWVCTFANDFDPMKAAAYRANFPGSEDHLHEGDVWNLNSSNLPGHADLAWASSPCQDFSLAGARAGLAGGRSSAFFGFWKLMEALDKEGIAPSTIVVENVVGLLSSHGGEDFSELCRALVGRGYRVGAVEIDAQRFVPQSRQRVFVIASKAKVGPTQSRIDPVEPLHSKRIMAAYNQLDASLRRSWVWWRLPFPPSTNASIDTVLEPDDDVRWFDDDKVERLRRLLSPRHKLKLVDAQESGVRTVGTLFRRMRLEAGLKVQRAELRFDGFAGCLRTPSGGSSKQFVVVVDPNNVRIRDLTGREAARLMGLGDEYKLPKSKNGALKLAGDGVVVDVVEWLRLNLLDALATAAREESYGQAPRARTGT